MNPYILRYQILSLARLPFRHPREIMQYCITNTDITQQNIVL